MWGNMASAQVFERRATMRGGGNAGEGKCTVEVVVDGAAQVEIRGDLAVLRNLSGQQPQWRRFECNAVLPPNPAGFRFRGIDGRGRQQLSREPRGGSSAVIQIEDPDNGSEGYTFDIMWSGQGGPYTDRGQGPYRDRGRPGDRRFTTDQAVQICQDAVRRQAQDRYRTAEIAFRQTSIDNNPGRADWVIGTLEARRRGQPDQIAKFSCSVDFDSGRVRSAQIDPFYSEGNRPGGGSDAAIQNCQRAVQARARQDGYDRIEFGSIRLDDQPGRNDRIVGDFRGIGRRGPESLRFSCNVDSRDGDVRSVDVTPR